MANLTERIYMLPQVLQDYIGMFNPEHREMMRLVCEELEWVECDNLCGDYARRLNQYGKNFCSAWCCGKDSIDRRRYIRKQRQLIVVSQSKEMLDRRE